MKQIKLISLLLCAALVLTLAGCAADPVGTEPTTQSTTQATITETTEEPTVPSSTDPSVTYHAPMFAISMPAVTETSKASDGETLFEYIYQTMTLSLPEAKPSAPMTLPGVCSLRMETASLPSFSMREWV